MFIVNALILFRLWAIFLERKELSFLSLPSSVQKFARTGTFFENFRDKGLQDFELRLIHSCDQAVSDPEKKQEWWVHFKIYANP